MALISSEECWASRLISNWYYYPAKYFWNGTTPSGSRSGNRYRGKHLIHRKHILNGHKEWELIFITCHPKMGNIRFFRLKVEVFPADHQCFFIRQIRSALAESRSNLNNDRQLNFFRHYKFPVWKIRIAIVNQRKLNSLQRGLIE